jgi:hypothetical protein
MASRTFLLVAGLALLTGCSPGASSAYSNHVRAAAAPATDRAIAFTGAGFDMEAAGNVSRATSDATWAGVLDTLNRYLDAGVLTPLRSGGPAGDLTPLFTSPAVDRVMRGPDRAAVIDENLPPTDDVRADAAVATLTALAGSDGVVSVVSASVDLRLTGQAAGAPVTVSRSGDLVLLPDGGTWKIDAYDIRASRTVAGEATTTTAHS